jgi:hypothetical protein
MKPDIVQIITLACVLIAAVVNIVTLVSKSEAKAAANAKTEVMLQNIYTKVDSIDRKTITIEGTLHQHGERITAVEASAKSAHHRIDGMNR